MIPNSFQSDSNDHTPTSKVWELPLLCILAKLGIISLLTFSHFDKCKVLPWCLFAFPWWWMRLSIFLLCLLAHLGEVPIQASCPVFSWVVCFFLLLVCRNSLLCAWAVCQFMYVRNIFPTCLFIHIIFYLINRST